MFFALVNLFYSGTNTTDKDLVRRMLRHYPIHDLPLNFGIDFFSTRYEVVAVVRVIVVTLELI